MNQLSFGIFKQSGRAIDESEFIPNVLFTCVAMVTKEEKIITNVVE